MPQSPFLSTDPNAGLGGSPFLSTDPNAGEPLQSDFKTTTTGDASSLDKFLAMLGDVPKGIEKGMGNTLFGLGKAVRDYTPVGRISDAILPGAFDQKPPTIVPTTTGEQIGFTGEQVGEFFLPGAKLAGASAKLAKLIEMAKSAGLTLAQTSDPTSAGVSGAITGVLPGGGAVKKLAGKLQGQAEKSVVQALGPTKEWAKDEATRIAPEMLTKGVRGSRATMLKQAESQVSAIGKKIGAEVDAVAKTGKTLPGGVVRGDIQLARDALMEVNAKGQRVVIAGFEAAASRLDKLDKFIETLGPDIPFAQAHRLKKAWDHIVSQAGLYGPKATSTATDNASAFAFREAAGAFRQQLAAGSPKLADLNAEFRFWKGLEDVLEETAQRTQSHGGGLVSGITGAAGVASGFASGNSFGDSVQNAVLGGLAGRQLVRVMQSPYWRTAVSARLKHGLADAMASGNAAKVEQVSAQILKSIPAQLRPLLDVQ